MNLFKILFCSFMIIFIFIIFLFKYNNDKNKKLTSYNEGYREGQIDALNGVIKYELKILPGQQIWVEK